MTTTETTTTYTPKVGDIFYTSWGYDQTNVDFYEVVKVTASQKSVYIKKIAQRTVTDDGGPVTYVVPAPGVFLTKSVRVYSPTGSRVETLYGGEQRFYDVVEEEIEPQLKRVSTPEWADGEPYLNISSYASASLWDGKPKYQTGLGWGH